MSNIKKYWLAARPFSLTVSVFPPILGVLIAVLENPGLQVNALHVVLTVLGCVFAHVGTNMFSDIHDY